MPHSGRFIPRRTWLLASLAGILTACDGPGGGHGTGGGRGDGTGGGRGDGTGGGGGRRKSQNQSGTPEQPKP